ncbi:phage baseplate assembly protein V [Haliangium sp.]|uniref:phage baseplate assembly protein V n=1 Tax=Haliangium sp. TaxID=2663208 RepID=UPI003D098176
MHILQAIARHEQGRRPYCELAVVTSVFDGEDEPDAGTVSVRLKDSGLPLPRIPVAVPLTGAAALPRLDDVVVVAFPRGDLASAIVIGQVYSDQRRPPSFSKDEAALVWPGDSDDPEAKAVDLRVKADGSSREVKVSLGGDKDASVVVADGSIEIKSGGAQIVISHSSGSDGAVELSAGGTKIRLDQDGDIALESAGTVSIKGSKVAIEGDTQVTVNGQVVELN